MGRIKGYYGRRGNRVKRLFQKMLATGLALLVVVTGMNTAPVFGAAATSTTSKEAACSVKVVKGKTGDGSVVPNGSTQLITTESSRLLLYSSEKGSWAMVDLATGNQVDRGSKQTFVSIPMPKGKFSLTFTPKNTSCGKWNIKINVDQVVVYQGAEGSGQQINPNQLVSVTELPANMQFSSTYPGKWTVGGLNQTVFEAKSFSVTVPDYFAGMNIPVTFVPNGGEEESAIRFFIQAGGQNKTTTKSQDFSMDIVGQLNAQSTPTEEKDGLAQNASIILYQKSLYKLWVTPNAEALIKDRVEFRESDPGYWTINNVLATNDHLNWNDTAVNLATYGVGTYKVQYLSKIDASKQWNGMVQIVEDSKPASSRGSCASVESGQAPPLQQLALSTESGALLANGGVTTITSTSELASYRSLKLTGTHVVYNGTEKVKKENVKTNVRYVHVPKLDWASEQLSFGEKREYSGGRISSANRVKIYYNNDTLIASFVPKSNDRDEWDGETELDLAAIIGKNEKKPGNYTISIENTLSNQTCSYEENADSYDKVLGTNTVKQTFTTTFTLNE